MKRPLTIDNLTINEENRLRKKVEILHVEKSRLDRIEEKMKRLERIYKRYSITSLWKQYLGWGKSYPFMKSRKKSLKDFVEISNNSLD